MEGGTEGWVVVGMSVEKVVGSTEGLLDGTVDGDVLGVFEG